MVTSKQALTFSYIALAINIASAKEAMYSFLAVEAIALELSIEPLGML